MIELTLWLYGKPSWDMELEGKTFLDTNMLRTHALLLKEHLERAADIIEQLQQKGWKLAESYGTLYSLTFYKKINKFQAERELNMLNIDLGEINLEQGEDFLEEASFAFEEQFEVASKI